MKRTRRWLSLKRRGAALADVALLPVAMVLLAPSGADTTTSVNTFTYKGAYSGTLTLRPSSDDCLYSNSFDVKSYLATLSHMKRVDTNVGRVLGP